MVVRMSWSPRLTKFTLRINQTTAQVEVDGETSDPIPHIIDGIVVHVREIRAYIDREQFIINPTNCDPLGVSDTFSTVPDVPFSQFELTFPEREYPALTANGNLCKGSLVMPTEMVGQNGMVLDQSTKISVTGCPKQKKSSHRKRKGKAHHRAKAKGRREEVGRSEGNGGNMV
jgi:hypothetical protein